MKYPLPVSFFLVLFSSGSFSQVSIGFSDMIQAGDTVTRYADTMTTLTAGPAGANQSWVMTTAVTHLTLVTKALAPSSTPYASSYANSNLAMTNDGLSYLYMQQDSSASVVKGAAGDLLMTGCNINTPFIPGMLLHDFPRSYGSNFTDDYSVDVTVSGSCVGQPVEQVRYKRVSTVYDTTDGWGEITTPVGKYQCLRIKRIDFSSDTTWIKLFPFSPWAVATTKVDTAYSYSWVSKEGKLAIAELANDSLDNPERFTWTGIAPLASDISSADVPGERKAVFPNPSSDKICFEDMPENSTLILFDATGRMVDCFTVRGSNFFVDVSNYIKGIYFYRIKNREGDFMSKGKFAVER